MPKRRTKKETFAGLYDRFKNTSKTRRDGSITTHPTIECPDVLESVVLKNCMTWLKAKQIVCDRNNVGAFNIDGRYRSYGIKGAGDIMGLTPLGRHFEVECKRGRGGTLSKDQQKRKVKILSNNGVYLVVHSVQELEIMFNKILER